MQRPGAVVFWPAKGDCPTWQGLVLGWRVDEVFEGQQECACDTFIVVGVIQSEAESEGLQRFHHVAQLCQTAKVLQPRVLGEWQSSRSTAPSESSVSDDQANRWLLTGRMAQGRSLEVQLIDHSTSNAVAEKAQVFLYDSSKLRSTWCFASEPSLRENNLQRMAKLFHEAQLVSPMLSMRPCRGRGCLSQKTRTPSCRRVFREILRPVMSGLRRTSEAALYLLCDVAQSKRWCPPEWRLSEMSCFVHHTELRLRQFIAMSDTVLPLYDGNPSNHRHCSDSEPTECKKSCEIPSSRPSLGELYKHRMRTDSVLVYFWRLFLDSAIGVSFWLFAVLALQRAGNLPPTCMGDQQPMSAHLHGMYPHVSAIAASMVHFGLEPAIGIFSNMTAATLVEGAPQGVKLNLPLARRLGALLTAGCDVYVAQYVRTVLNTVTWLECGLFQNENVAQELCSAAEPRECESAITHTATPFLCFLLCCGGFSFAAAALADVWTIFILPVQVVCVWPLSSAASRRYNPLKLAARCRRLSVGCCAGSTYRFLYFGATGRFCSHCCACLWGARWGRVGRCAFRQQDAIRLCLGPIHVAVNIVFFFRLFCTQANVLKSRVDKTDLQPMQLLLGTIVFVSMVFLSATLAVYGTILALLWMGLLLPRLALVSTVRLFQTLPCTHQSANVASTRASLSEGHLAHYKMIWRSHPSRVDVTTRGYFSYLLQWFALGRKNLPSIHKQ